MSEFWCVTEDDGQQKSVHLLNPKTLQLRPDIKNQLKKTIIVWSVYIIRYAQA